MLHVPLATALGRSDAPAWLERHGWISAAQARSLLPHAALDPVHVDAHGTPLHTRGPDRHINRTWKPTKPTGTQQGVRAQLLDWARRTASSPPDIITTPEPQYRPSDALTRFLRTRDLRCTAPGCSQPAHRCQQDHLIPYDQGGPTSAANLAPKSERCHNAKTHGDWTTTRHEDGSTTWTSPLQRRYWTPSSWVAPPVEDPDRPLPHPDDPRLVGKSRPRFTIDDEPDDHAPGLHRMLTRAETADTKTATTAARSPAARPTGPEVFCPPVSLVKGKTPPPF